MKHQVTPKEVEQAHAFCALVDRWKGCIQYDAIPNRILFTIGSLNPGGAERQLTYTATSLAQAGYTDLFVHCIVPKEEHKGDFGRQIEQAGGTIVSLQDTEHSQLPPMFRQQLQTTFGDEGEYYFTTVLKYMNEIATIKPSVLHVWLDMPEVALAGILAGVKKIVLSWRSCPPYHFTFHNMLMFPMYYAVTRHEGITLSCNSKAGAEEYEDWLQLPRGTVNVHHNAINAQWQKSSADASNALRANLGIPSEATVIGGLFRLSKEKRPLLWIDAAELVAQKLPNVYFVLFGDGDFAKPAAEYIEQKGLASRIKLAGATTDAAAAYSILDLFLLTSRIEGLPNVLLEAQTMGVPAVTTHAGGARETIWEGVTGQVTLDDSPQSIANALISCLETPGWLEKAKQHAPEFVRQHFSLPAMRQRTLTMYGLP